MARETPPPEPAGDIPDWFMTYSDVITLLMTFFILLLTFASNEPEQFERLQASMFSGTGGTGVAGQRVDGMERESFVIRTRPRSARLTMRGSEMPPTQTDPETDDIKGALSGLEDDEQRAVTPRNAIQIPLTLLLNEQFTDVSSVGQQHLRMVTRQVRRPGMHLALAVHPSDDVEPLIAIAKYLISQGLKPGQIAFATSRVMKPGFSLVRLEIIREERG